MAVQPSLQGQGLGRAMLIEAERIGRAWPANAICLDAYDTAAGAGGFYAACGYEERGRVTYRGTPLIYYERLLENASD
jgi:GNAT superfamily N-acetyltransferase